MTNKKFRDLLKKSTSPLEKYVLEDALQEDNAKEYLESVLEHGCVSGMVSSLIYYNNTKEFYIKYMEEIEEIIQDIQDNAGYNVLENAKFPLYNWLAWLGYEETARKIIDNL